MQTNKFGENLGEFFGTVAWLWIFYRFSQDGKVLLGYEHPWDHGHHGGDHDDHGHGHGEHKILSQAEHKEQWDTVAATFVKPGEEDDDDEDEDDDDE